MYKKLIAVLMSASLCPAALASQTGLYITTYDACKHQKMKDELPYFLPKQHAVIKITYSIYELLPGAEPSEPSAQLSSGTEESHTYSLLDVPVRTAQSSAPHELVSGDGKVLAVDGKVLILQQTHYPGKLTPGKNVLIYSQRPIPGSNIPALIPIAVAQVTSIFQNLVYATLIAGKPSKDLPCGVLDPSVKPDSVALVNDGPATDNGKKHYVAHIVTQPSVDLVSDPDPKLHFMVHLDHLSGLATDTDAAKITTSENTGIITGINMKFTDRTADIIEHVANTVVNVAKTASHFALPSGALADKLSFATAFKQLDGTKPDDEFSKDIAKKLKELVQPVNSLDILKSQLQDELIKTDVTEKHIGDLTLVKTVDLDTGDVCTSLEPASADKTKNADQKPTQQNDQNGKSPDEKGNTPGAQQPNAAAVEGHVKEAESSVQNDQQHRQICEA